MYVWYTTFDSALKVRIAPNFFSYDNNKACKKLFSEKELFDEPCHYPTDKNIAFC
jgi:hypothetical protein